MQKLIYVLIALFIFTGCSETPEQVSSSSVLITNAIIYDGSGGDPITGAIRIADGLISEIGNISPLEGEETFDADGKVLTPGFIDQHSHHDQGLLENPASPSLLEQGITTIVAGLDGFAGSLTEADYVSIEENMKAFEANPAAINLAYFGPHNTYRNMVMGEDHVRYATDEEIGQMKTLLEADLEAGALGLATGLEYVPALYSNTEEVVELAKVAAAHGGRYSSHIRSEDITAMDAFAEAITIAREANIPVNISHIKLAMASLHGRAPEVIAMLNAARAEGLEITADQYPYDGWNSGLQLLVLSRDFYDRESAEFGLTSIADPSMIIFGRHPRKPDYTGKTLAQVAEEESRDPVFLLMSLLQEAERDDYGISVIGRNIGTSDIEEFMTWEHTAIASDGGIDGRHPRGQGTFTRVLSSYVREQGVLTLTEAIRKMTSLPAKSLGFKNRGLIEEGYIADLVIFDPDTVQDHGTYEDPIQYSTGIHAVWVGGELVWDGERETGARPGRIIRRAD